MTASPSLPPGNYSQLDEPLPEDATENAAHRSYSVDDAVESTGMGRFQYLLIALTGLCWTAESMEMLLLSFIKQPLQCSWGISDARAALITTAVGVGMLTGATFWGLIGDKFGRRVGFISSTAVTFFMGIASALSPNYISILLTRGAVGFGIGGVPVAYSLLMEFLPKSQRGSWGMVISIFWSLGAVFEAAVAMAVLPRWGWRWLIGVSTLPLFLVLILGFMIQESPRWLVARGKLDRAHMVLCRMAAYNMRPLPEGQLVAAADGLPSKGGALQLVRSGVRSFTFKVSVMWFAAAFTYYGLVMLQPELIAAENAGRRCTYVRTECGGLLDQLACEKDKLCVWGNGASANGTEVCEAALIDETKAPNAQRSLLTLDTSVMRHPGHEGNETDAEPEPASAGSTNVEAKSSPGEKSKLQVQKEACANKLTREDFMSTLWASIGEVPGVLIAFAVLDHIGRRPLIGYSFGITSVTFPLLLLCIGRLGETTVFFIARGASSAAFQATYLYTNEVYPARVRTTAMGVCSSIARVGLIVTPIFAQFLSNVNISATMWTYFGISMAAVLAVIFAPIETTGWRLLERMDELVAVLRGDVRMGDNEVDFDPFGKEGTAPAIVRWLRWKAPIDARSTGNALQSVNDQRRVEDGDVYE
eukprot:TRINITY_DN47794_c0_g1_i1.p1 TRINITY_DN47794_c0_g1~~TRINITY_DN47794_c0_g1_i1.p1  ORF type:complete len:646 (+),score=85.99 TRINITY_DN47794_c0_g1_i1:1368-3305(+)